jgi:hypothetical protein
MMFDPFNLSQYWGPILFYLKVFALLLGVLAFSLLLRSLGPVLRAAQWLVGYTPGTRPSDLVAGIALGLRMVVFAGLICGVFWLLVRR